MIPPLKSTLFALCTLMLSAVSLNSQAVDNYVTDNFFVPLRSGAGNDFRITNSRIRSGTKLIILESPPGDWAKIQLPGGTQGWMRKQYILNGPTAKMQLNAALSAQKAAEEQLVKYTALLNQLQSQHRDLQKNSGSTDKQFADLSARFQNLKMLSEDAVNLNTRYRNLLAEHEVLMTQQDALKAENDMLRNDQTVKHWIYAFLLIIAGVVLTLIIPALRPPKRHSNQIL
ncbi:TIGR04211 family SH3 domain-containing protein [Marinagarivorans algicola]|uniref:TIGR04211 family SH3 domain-containing protein n=1 Tax=Marinagarivorans algicola TaxID=1513270 RepID=UPI003734DCD3